MSTTWPASPRRRGPGATARPEERPNHAALAENLKRLREAEDARGRSPRSSRCRSPRPSSWTTVRRCWPPSASANGIVIAPAFEDPADDRAFQILDQVFPDRQVVQIRALDILQGGGGIHHHPAAARRKPRR